MERGLLDGAEPYTLAMLLDAFAADKGGPDYGILATDLDREVLRTARRGIYPAALLDPVPTVLRKRYVMSASDPKRDEMRIVPALRSSIGFAQMNLMDERYPVGDPMDIIFCRNVLIYFDKPTQERWCAVWPTACAPAAGCSWAIPNRSRVSTFP